jgi:2-methylcitrate dehydratase
LLEKFSANLATRFAPDRCQEIIALSMNPDRLLATPLDKFMDLFVVESLGQSRV